MLRLIHSGVADTIMYWVNTNVSTFPFVVLLPAQGFFDLQIRWSSAWAWGNSNCLHTGSFGFSTTWCSRGDLVDILFFLPFVRLHFPPLSVYSSDRFKLSLIPRPSFSSQMQMRPSANHIPNSFANPDFLAKVWNAQSWYFHYDKLFDIVVTTANTIGHTLYFCKNHMTIKY